MKELKKFSVVLAIAVLVALFFVVIWAYNVTSDHTSKINTLWTAVGSTAEILSHAEKERQEMKSSLLDLGVLFKDSQQNKKTNFTNVFDALKSMEMAIKKNDSSYTLPSAARLVGEGRKKKKYESESEDSSDITDSEVEAELRRRKKRRS